MIDPFRAIKHDVYNQSELADEFPQPQLDKYAVEDCYRLKIGSLGRSLISSSRRKASGVIKASNGLNQLPITFNFSILEQNEVSVGYTISGVQYGHIIGLEGSLVRFGERSYFICRCGRLCAVLYLRPDCPLFFACRECLHLEYEICRLNRRSKYGGLAYALSRQMKLADMQKSIARLTYRDKPTRKAVSFLVAANKWQTPAMS